MVCPTAPGVDADYPSCESRNQRAGWFFHHLDANGIRFKSITPQDDVLLIKFDSSAQSAAAKAVLDRTLPQGYIIAQQDDDSHVASWMSRLRDTSHRFG